MAADVARLDGVFAVPPLPRRNDPRRTLNVDAAECVARHIEDGGITRFLYGGNAFLYHASLGEFETLIDWLSGFPPQRWPIPSIGPSFGRAMDQARLLRKYAFRAVMMLPCNDPRDARGLEAGLREIAAAAGRTSGTAPKRCGARSCHWRTCATSGDPPACCIMRPNWPASRRRGRFRHTCRSSQRRNCSSSLLLLARCGIATNERGS